MNPKKRHKGNVSFNVIVDTEDGEVVDFFWNEDHDPPPYIKQKKKRGDAEKKRRPS